MPQEEQVAGLGKEQVLAGKGRGRVERGSYVGILVVNQKGSHFPFSLVVSLD